MYENIFKTHDCMCDSYKTMLLKHDRHPTLIKQETKITLPDIKKRLKIVLKLI